MRSRIVWALSSSLASPQRPLWPASSGLLTPGLQARKAAVEVDVVLQRYFLPYPSYQIYPHLKKRSKMAAP